MNDLAQLSRAVQMLAEARSLDEVTSIRSMAKAAETYARAEKLGDEAEHHAREIRVRAARKAGELLRQMREDRTRMPRGGPGNRVVVPAAALQPTLSQLGVTKKQSATWQKIAAVPDDEFERQVAAGQGENAIAEGRIRKRSGPHHPKARPGPKTKTNGYTLKQSMQGLQSAAVQVQGLAEALDGGLLGDWSRLHDIDDAQDWFRAIEEALPVLSARLRRALRDWKEKAA